ncbi:sensor histidine kinase [Telmatospirillum siberiense]|uniref:C4-dicarboxylate transport sensor protein DctB n=1 Tax=Telmatospirillum siberiense TaxID=382514 RepID=A0A2N3PWE5_9PROT|nr:ATP-binding protein [Telmatospirillum siberiense]PKU24733.1 sensor histidine kinase [Telmatospirillum siberiense]
MARPFRRWLHNAMPLLAAIGIGAVVVWQAASLGRSGAMTSATAHGFQRLRLYSSTIVNALERYSYLPFMLAHDGKVRALLADQTDPVRLRAVDEWLEGANAAAGSTALYIENLEGTAIAASNWREPDTYVGHRYEFRPFFKDAISTGGGRWFGVGVTTRIPGYFLARAVLDGDSPQGVAIVKVDLEQLQREWASGGEKVMVTDIHNIAILTSQPDWKYAVLGTLDAEARATLDATQQYADVPLRSVKVIQSRDIEKDVHILTLETDGRRRSYLVQSAAIPGESWTIHYLTDMNDILAGSRNAAIIAAFGWIIVLLLLLFLRQRFLRIVAQAKARDEVAEALRTARDELELTVAKRTADLQAEIEERLRTERELRDAQTELVHAGKMAALGQMSATVAHELSQPLTAVQTYLASARVFAQRGDLGQVFRNLGLIDDLNQRMGHIASHLKTFSRKGGSRREPVLLAEVAKRAMMLVEARAKSEKAIIVCDIPPDACILGDGIRLEQVIVNLFGNALDAVKACQVKRLSMTAEASEGTWVIKVADNGPGIAPEHVEHVFDPFFTTKEVGEGLGIGLSLSESIIRDIGGSMRAENAPGGGAVFVITLPEHSPAPAPGGGSHG